MDVRGFVQENGLECVGVNFFRQVWDEAVPEIHRTAFGTSPHPCRIILCAKIGLTLVIRRNGGVGVWSHAKDQSIRGRTGHETFQVRFGINTSLSLSSFSSDSRCRVYTLSYSDSYSNIRLPFHNLTSQNLVLLPTPRKTLVRTSSLAYLILFPSTPTPNPVPAPITKSIRSGPRSRTRTSPNLKQRRIR